MQTRGSLPDEIVYSLHFLQVLSICYNKQLKGRATHMLPVHVVVVVVVVQ